jgi:phenylalanyl-tRNA synthetase alpha chain
LLPNHPLGIISKLITGHFEKSNSIAAPASASGIPGALPTKFKVFDQLPPFASVKRNFDDLLVPADHVSRRRTDTYYANGSETVLRTHTSAHQSELLDAGHNAFLVVGDVYRRDEIDASHYPVFHQMEGVRVWTPEELKSQLGSDATPDSAIVKEFVVQDLKHQIDGLVKVLFGDAERRWVDAYFPFTDPSFELEVRYQDKWLEVLGSGMIQNRILANAGMSLCVTS